MARRAYLFDGSFHGASDIVAQQLSLMVVREQGGGIVLAYASRPADKEGVKHLSGIIASSPLIGLSHPPFFITRWIGGILSKFFPNFPLDAPVDGKSLSHDAAVGKAFASDPLVRAHVTLGIVDAMLSRVRRDCTKLITHSNMWIALGRRAFAR